MSRNPAAIIGYLRAPIGLGESARRQVRALRSVGYPNTVYDVPLTHRHLLPFEGLSRPPADAPIAIFHINPPEMLAEHGTSIVDRRRTHVIGYWHWELPHLPLNWIPAIRLVDEIWVPTEFGTRPFREVTDKPIRVVTHAVPDNDMSLAKARGVFGLPEDRRIFLSIFDTDSFPARKNLAGAIRAFRDAFPVRTASSPLMVVKVHGAANRSPHFHNLLRDIKANPGFVLLDGTLEHFEVRALQASCDYFVSLHRAEGFGFNIAECMAAGRLAIATDYSGNQDFMRADNSMLIPQEIVAVRPEEYIGVSEGQTWAEPIHEAAVEAMRWVVAHPAAADALAAKGKADMLEFNSFESVGHKIAGLLGERKPRSGVIGQTVPKTTSRNAPCPCGSGKKFKYCHGDIGAPAS